MINEPPANGFRPTASNPLLILLLVNIDSFHFVFAKLLRPHLSPYVSVFYIMAIAVLQVGLYGWIRGRIHFRTLFRNRWFFLSIGALIGVSTIINYEAVAFIDPGTASLLAKSSILMSVVLGIFWLKEKLTKMQGFILSGTQTPENECPCHCPDAQFFSGHILDLHNIRYCADGSATHWRGRNHLRCFYGNHQTEGLTLSCAIFYLPAPCPFMGINLAPPQPNSYRNWEWL
jgi:uncharacterized membrane protein